MIYNVHYPDGTVRQHKTYYNDICLPSLGRVFFNQIDPVSVMQYFEIVEIGEEDIWVENITQQEYDAAINNGTLKYYVFFIKRDGYILDNYKPTLVESITYDI